MGAQPDDWYESIFSSAEIEELLDGWNRDHDLHPDEFIRVELVFPKDKAKDFVEAALEKFWLPPVRKDLLAFTRQVALIVRTKL